MKYRVRIFPIKTILIQVMLLFLVRTDLRAQESMGERIYQERMFAFPNGKMKALILSYDDGLLQDSIMVSILNKYKLKGSFNLNSAYFGDDALWLKSLTGKTGKYLNRAQVKRIYKEHEIAAHTRTHPHLPELTKEEIKEEIRVNIEELSTLSENPITSFAYPFGEFNKQIVEILKSTGITNARTVNDTKTFNLPDDFFIWNPTCHHTQATSLLKEFVSKSVEKPILFHIWGHSWEFDRNQENNNWKYFDSICQRLSSTKNIWSASAGEFIEYLNAVKAISGEKVLTNNSNLMLWLIIKGKLVQLKPKGTISTE